MALVDGFKSKAAALGLGALALSGVAHADDDQARQYAAVTAESPQQANFSMAASTTPDIELVSFAAGDAIRWAAKHDGVAVSVKLGTDSLATPEQIVQILSQELQDAGASSYTFYFEQNDIEATYLSYHYGKDGGASEGPYLLGDARSGARRAAQQNAFYLDHPELGM